MGRIVAELTDTSTVDLTKARELFVQHIRNNADLQINTVMVVDDDIYARKLVSKLIERSCPMLKVVQAINGEDALRRLAEIRQTQKKDPLFIITDLHMPVMDGWDFITALRKDYQAKGLNQGIPIIVLSASSGEKGFLFSRKTLAGEAAKYSPLVAVAKDSCVNPSKYDTVGEQGLASWIEYFIANN